MSTRLLHLADVHLDRAFAGMGCHGQLAVRRRFGLRDALARAGTTARQLGCTAVTIAGDLYEHDRSGADTAAFLVETFRSWQPMEVLLAPGNHDPLMPGSIYSRTEWPANVHLFTATALEPHPLGRTLTVWGLAHREPAWQGDPLAGAAPSGDGVHLALFHGAELGSRPDGKSVHGPFRAASIRERGFAAALCGHYHRRRLDHATGLVYPGSPEPLTFDESEPRGPVLVTVGDDGGVGFEPLVDNRWHARTAVADVGGVANLSACLELAAEAAAMVGAGADPSTTMVRLDLTGVVPDSVALDLFTVETFVAERTGLAAVRVRDLTTAAVRLHGNAEGTVRSAFAAAVAAAAASASAEDAALLDDALRYGLQALSGVEVGLR